MPRKQWGPGNPLWEWQNKRKSNKKRQRKRYSGVKMARRKRRSIRRYFPRRRRGRADRRIPILPLAGLAAGLMTANRNGAFQQITSGDFSGGLQNLSRELVVNATGYDYVAQGWMPSRLLEFYGPIIAGSIGSKVATWTGANRYMKRIPFIGGKIKL